MVKDWFFVILFFIFLILKLVGVIDWSWWCVAAPLWVPVAIALFVCLGVLLWAWAKIFMFRRKVKKAERKGVVWAR